MDRRDLQGKHLSYSFKFPRLEVTQSHVNHRWNFPFLVTQNKCKQDLTTLKLGEMLKIGKKRKEQLKAIHIFFVG